MNNLTPSNFNAEAREAIILKTHSFLSKYDKKPVRSPYVARAWLSEKDLRKFLFLVKREK